MRVGKASERMDLSAQCTSQKKTTRYSVLSKPDQTIFAGVVAACSGLAARRPMTTMESKASLNWGLTNTPAK